MYGDATVGTERWEAHRDEHAASRVPMGGQLIRMTCVRCRTFSSGSLSLCAAHRSGGPHLAFRRGFTLFADTMKHLLFLSVCLCGIATATTGDASSESMQDRVKRYASGRLGWDGALLSLVFVFAALSALSPSYIVWVLSGCGACSRADPEEQEALRKNAVREHRAL